MQTGWTGVAIINDVPAYKLMGGASCPSADVQENGLFLYADDGTGKYTQISKSTFTIDTTPPAAPTANGVTSGEQLVDVDFGSHTSSSTVTTDGGTGGIKDTNFKGYQILCEELDSSGSSVGPAFSSAPTAEYEVSVNLCGTSSPDGGSTVADAGVSDSAMSDMAQSTFLPGPIPLAGDAGPDAAAGAGTEGKPCLPNDQCNLGLKCTNIAGNKFCVKIPAGQEGGECKASDGGAGTCDAGLVCTTIGAKSYCIKGATPDSGTTTPDMTTVADQCVGECLTPDAGVSADSGTVVPSSGLTSLDKRYVCSKKITSPGKVRITGLKNNTSYAFYVVTIDKLKNPSSLTKVGTGKPVNEEDFWERYKRAGGQADGEYCFVATAAYGDYDHPHVRVLRGFRDEVLMSSEAGRSFVEGYYRHAPGPARWLAGHDAARTLARAALWPVTLTAGAVLYTSAADKALLLLAACMLLYLRRTRRRRASTREVAR